MIPISFESHSTESSEKEELEPKRRSSYTASRPRPILIPIETKPKLVPDQDIGKEISYYSKIAKIVIFVRMAALFSCIVSFGSEYLAFLTVLVFDLAGIAGTLTKKYGINILYTIAVLLLAVLNLFGLFFSIIMTILIVEETEAKFYTKLTVIFNILILVQAFQLFIQFKFCVKIKNASKKNLAFLNQILQRTTTPYQLVHIGIEFKRNSV